MSLDRPLIEKVARKCRKVFEHSGDLGALVTKTNIGGVVNAIQENKGCYIVITSVEEALPVLSFTLRFDLIMRYIHHKTRDVVNEKDSVLHLIGFLPDSDRRVEDALAFRELGHCLFHWPPGDRECETVEGGYFVVYSQEDKEEADAFMCLCLSNFFNAKEWNRPIETVIGKAVRRAWKKVRWCRMKGLLRAEV